MQYSRQVGLIGEVRPRFPWFGMFALSAAIFLMCSTIMTLAGSSTSRFCAQGVRGGASVVVVVDGASVGNGVGELDGGNGSAVVVVTGSAVVVVVGPAVVVVVGSAVVVVVGPAVVVVLGGRVVVVLGGRVVVVLGASVVVLVASSGLHHSHAARKLLEGNTSLSFSGLVSAFRLANPIDANLTPLVGGPLGSPS